MRFMMLMIPLGYEQAAPGTMPPADAVAAMMKYNEALKAAGGLVTLDGPDPPAVGVGGRDDEIQRGAESGGRAERAGRAASAVDGRARVVQGRQADRDRRAVRRSEGSARRLLDDRGEVA